MKKRLTLKIAGVLLTFATVLQFIPVYAEGTSDVPQTLSTEKQAANPYQISVQELLSVHPQLANKLTYTEQELQIPDVMNAKTIVNQVKARRANLVAMEQAEKEKQAKAAAARATQSAANTKAVRTASTNSSAQTATKTNAKSASTASSNTVTVAGRAYNYKKVMNMRATAYTADPSENGQWGAVDALGNELKLGTVAVDPDVIPLGTKLFITGYQFKHLPYGGYLATATDTGGAIKGNKIDLFVPVSKQTGNTFGVQNIKVYVLK